MVVVVVVGGGGEGSTLFRRRLRCGLQSYIETEGET